MQLLTQSIKKLKRSTSGSFAPILALLAIPLFMAIGAAVDYTNALRVKSKIQDIVDSAVLAAAKRTDADDAKQIAKDFYDANALSFVNHFTLDNREIVVSETDSARTVTMTVTGQVDSIFSKIWTPEVFTIGVEASADQSIKLLEVAMVLDISVSMRGVKINKLKEAAKGFVSDILDSTTSDNASVSLVPFGGSVNIGGYFDTLVVDPSGAIADPSISQYSLGTNMDGNMFRFSNGSKCVEAYQSDFDDQMIPHASRGEIPHFYTWGNQNQDAPWCPTDATAAVFNSKNADLLKDSIDDWDLSVGTAMDVGTLWGLKALSPEMRGEISGDFPDRPYDYDEANNNKVLIVMTDGRITAQYRNIDITDVRAATNNSNIQTIVEEGHNNDTQNTNTAVGRFKHACENAKVNNIVVFTIGYQIDAGSDTEALLKSCASDSSKYFLQTSNDLTAVFDEINSAIRQVTMTR